MKRRRVALAMALVMLCTSVPSYGLTGYAAESGADEIILDEADMHVHTDDENSVGGARTRICS